jgi:hypothetical protein
VLQKERKERTALMPDEDFEDDFLEMQENNHRKCGSTDSIPGAI